MDVPPNLRPDAFAGTAEAYLRYRPPYPQELLESLLDEVSGREMLVDLASGPGRVALDLADAFARIVAIDLEPEMVAVGRAEAERRGIGNVEWGIGPAETAEVAEGLVDLITVGEAFHRLDQTRVLENARRWLRPGGGFASLGARILLGGGEAWQRTLGEVARRWMPAGWAQGRAGGAVEIADIEAAIAAAGFAETHRQIFEAPLTWSMDSVLGALSSMSVCSERALEGRFPAFAAELRAALGDGPFHETVSWSYILGRQALAGPTG